MVQGMQGSWGASLGEVAAAAVAADAVAAVSVKEDVGVLQLLPRTAACPLLVREARAAPWSAHGVLHFFAAGEELAQMMCAAAASMRACACVRC
jgi:hypothetical protein